MRLVRLVLCLLLCSTSVAWPAAARADDFDLRAAIREGTCDDRGGRIASLEDPVLPRGTEEGANDGVPALVSDTVVDVPIAGLLADDAIVAITREGKSGVAACGAIGGLLTRRDVLAIQVETVGGSGVWGIAVFSPNEDDDDRTDVRLYLGGPGLAADAPAPTGASGSDADGNAGQTAGRETYVSPNFGFSVTYDPAVWSVESGPGTNEQGNDFFVLGRFGTAVYFDGVHADVDAPTCVGIMSERVAQGSDVAAFAPMSGAGGPFSGGGPDDAFGTFVATRLVDSGGRIPQAVYIRCIVLVPWQSMLVIRQYCAEMLYPSAAAQREELLTGLTLP